MAAVVSISSDILNWVDTAAHLNDSTRATLELWKSGKKQPTFHQLEDFSVKTHIPLGYFFLNTPPVESLELLVFRTVDSLSLQNPSRDLIDTVRQMENVQEWMRDYVIASQSEKISFVGSLDTHADAVTTANAVRDVLSLSLKWFENKRTAVDAFNAIRQAISDIGVIVMKNGIVGANTHRPLNIDEFRAFALVDKYAPLIFINSTDSRGGMLFSLLHEFIHIGIGASSLFNVKTGDINLNFVNPHEVACNAVTAEIIAPLSVFRAGWQESGGDTGDKTQSLASRFNCSQSVIARRALDCGYIDNTEYEKLIAQAKQVMKSKTTSSGGDYYKTQASRIDPKFLLALNSSLQEGRTLHTEAFRLTNTNRTTFDTLLSEVRGERK
jgi:Zn-dependent peptidase ImmA (M78 family)